MGGGFTWFSRHAAISFPSTRSFHTTPAASESGDAAAAAAAAAGDGDWGLGEAPLSAGRPTPLAPAGDPP